jgi:hypothetical protein
MKNTHLELTDQIVLLRPFMLKDAEEHLAGEDEAQRGIGSSSESLS